MVIATYNTSTSIHLLKESQFRYNAQDIFDPILVVAMTFTHQSVFSSVSPNTIL